MIKCTKIDNGLAKLMVHPAAFSRFGGNKRLSLLLK